MTDKKQAPEMVEVTIWGNHTHGGKPVEPGTAIKVTADQAKWLEANGVLKEPKKEG